MNSGWLNQSIHFCNHFRHDKMHFFLNLFSDLQLICLTAKSGEMVKDGSSMKNNTPQSCPHARTVTLTDPIQDP